MEGDGDDEHYTVLGLPSGEEGFSLSEKEIRQAYKRKAFELHPDKRPHDDDDEENANRKFQKLQSSYQVLKDATSRKLYDDRLRVKISTTLKKREQQGGRARASRRARDYEASEEEELDELIKRRCREHVARKKQQAMDRPGGEEKQAKKKKTLMEEDLREIQELVRQNIARRCREQYRPSDF